MDNGFLCLEIEEYAIQLENIGNLLSIFLDLVKQERTREHEISDAETAENFRKRLLRFNSIVHISSSVIDRIAAGMNTLTSIDAGKVPQEK